MSDSSAPLLWQRWQEAQQEAQQEALFSLDSLDLVIPQESVGQMMEEVQLSQSFWVFLGSAS